MVVDVVVTVVVVEVSVVVVAVLVPNDRLMSKHCLCNESSYLLLSLYLFNEIKFTIEFFNK